KQYAALRSALSTSYSSIHNTHLICLHAYSHAHPDLHSFPTTTLFRSLERVKLPKERVIMVGDNYHTDIEAAINVGMDSLLVYTGLSRPEEVIKEKIQPTYKVNNLDEWEI